MRDNVRVGPMCGGRGVTECDLLVTVPREERTMQTNMEGVWLLISKYSLYECFNSSMRSKFVGYLTNFEDVLMLKNDNESL